MNGLVWFIYIAWYVLFVAGLWCMFVKAGEEGWKAIIPIWNTLAGIAPTPVEMARGDAVLGPRGPHPDHLLRAEVRRDECEPGHPDREAPSSVSSSC